MNEREISIVDLMVEILLHWRMFIIWMIAGAVLLGAFSYVRSSRAVKEQETLLEEEQNLEEELTEAEIEDVMYVIDYEEAYAAQKAYQEDRLLIQMDHEHVCKSEATIGIDGGERQRSYDIEKVYEDIVVSGEMIAEVSEKTGMKISDINETLFLSRGGTGGDSLGATDGISTFRIAAIHGDEEESKKMLETVITLLKEKKSDVENILGEHEIIVVNESFAVVTDVSVSDRQLTVKRDLASMRKTVSDIREALSETERQYYDLLTESEETEEEDELEENVSASGISVKYVILGVFMAAFLYAFVLLLVYIFNTKVRATDSLQELYGLPQLGMIPTEKDKKKILGFVDRWIISIRDHNKRQFGSEEALELVAVAVKMAAGKEALPQIALMGCGLKGQSFDICEKIKARLQKENIQVNILNNVLYDAQMMEELEKEKGVVLVEGAGTTLYDEIARELELLKRQDIKVLGGVLVG